MCCVFVFTALDKSAIGTGSLCVPNSPFSVDVDARHDFKLPDPERPIAVNIAVFGAFKEHNCPEMLVFATKRLSKEYQGVV